MAQYPNLYNVELTKGPAVVQLQQMFLGDVLANRIGAIVTENGEAVTLGGTCSGTAILSNGGTVPIDGTVSGNTCYIDLPPAVYAVEGPVEIFVTNVSGGKTTTLVAAFGNVRRKETGTVIDPGTIIPSVSALIDAIDTAVASIPADYTALLAAVAPTFSASADYAAGRYVWYSGDLYRFISDHAAGSWTGADAVQVALANDVSGLMGLALECKPVTPEEATSVYSNLAENLPVNTYTWAAVSSYNDLPDGIPSAEYGWIITLSPTYRGGTVATETQFFIRTNPSDDVFDLYIRRTQSGTMSGWTRINNPDYIENVGQLASGDLNSFTGNKCALLISGNTYANAPFAIGTIFNLDFSSTLSVQYGYQFGTGAIWYRRKSTTWGDWINLVPNMDKYRTGGKYVAFGDSLTYGAVWSPTSGTALHQVKEEWRIPTRIALATGMNNSFANEAIGGIGYFKEQDGQTLISQIADYDFTGVELVTVMAGANDHFYTDLGTAADADDANTICSAIKNIIHTITAANPKTQIIIIQPTPCGIDGTQYDVWSSKQGDGYVFRWSLNEFDAQVSQLCKNEHVGYLNWCDSVMCRNWKYAGYNGATGPNYTHPTADKDYCLLGNFMAGKVSALYHGLN